MLAATTCCGCDEYAMPATGGVDACDEVECPMPDEERCPALVAACVDGACTAACVPVACDLVCDAGFARDAAGCLTCACAPGSADVPACTGDTDCVQVAADCCGCARGGADTAVPAAEADDFSESLMCPSDPADAACPEVDVCDPSLTAQCRGGQCVLASSEDALTTTCGRPDLAICTEGTVCVLNADPAAAMAGVGTCEPP